MKLFWYVVALAINAAVGINAWFHSIGILLGISTVCAIIFIFLIVIEIHSKSKETS